MEGRELERILQPRPPKTPPKQHATNSAVKYSPRKAASREAVAVMASTKNLMTDAGLCSDTTELTEQMRIEQALNDL